MGHRQQAELAERIVASCLELPEAEWGHAIEAACADHAQLAPAIRGIFGALRAAGLVGLAADPRRLGEFLLLERIGEGAMGDVFRARQQSVDRDVALKIVRSDTRFQPDTATRFRREVAAIAQLQHPGIVKVLTCGVEDGVPYYAMELLDGMTVADVLIELRGRAPGDLRGRDLAEVLGVPAALFPGGWAETCFRIVSKVAAALEHVHGQQVLHRDIKPANVMLTRNGEPVLIDFGLARVGDDVRLTRTGARLGSMPYLAPELWKAPSAHGVQSEVYALGLVLWEMLALRPAFLAKTDEGLREAVLGGRLPRLRSIQPAVSPDAETVCLAAIDLDPARRYAGCGEFARDLENVIALRPISARRVGRFRSLLRAVARRRALSASLGLSLVVVVLAMFLLTTDRAARRAEVDYELKDRRLDAKWAISALTFLQGRGDTSLWPIGPDKTPSYEFWALQAKNLLEYMTEAKARCDADRHLFAQPQPPLGPAELGRNFFAEADPLQDLNHAVYLTERAALLAMKALQGSIQLMESCGEMGHRMAAISSDAATMAAWQHAAERASASGLYPGFSLRPQIGLMPLGEDPATGRLLFWHVTSGSKPDLGAGLTCATDPDVGLVLELMPPPAPGEPAFFIAQQPVTFAIWARLGWGVPKARLRDTAPYTYVAFHEAISVLRRMNLVLPSRAQWRSQQLDHRSPDGIHEWCADWVDKKQWCCIMPEGGLLGGAPIPPEQDLQSLVYRHAALGIRAVRLLDEVPATLVTESEKRFAAAGFAGWTCGATGGKESGGAWKLREGGGNPGDCIETVTFSGYAFLFCLHPEAIWDPARDGVWTDLDMDVECRTLSRWGLGETVMPIIEQGGAVFFGTDFWLVTGRIKEWHKASVVGYRPTDFSQVMPRDWGRDPTMLDAAGGARPDVSSTAKPMRFGFGVYSRENGVYRQVFDNFRLAVRRRVVK